MFVCGLFRLTYTQQQPRRSTTKLVHDVGSLQRTGLTPLCVCVFPPEFLLLKRTHARVRARTHARTHRLPVSPSWSTRPPPPPTESPPSGVLGRTTTEPPNTTLSAAVQDSRGGGQNLGRTMPHSHGIRGTVDERRRDTRQREPLTATMFKVETFEQSSRRA